MRKFLITAVALAVAACGAGDPYQAAIPSFKDAGAVDAAISSVKAEDKQILRGYFFRKRNEDVGLIETTDMKPKTIEQAIVEQRYVLAKGEKEMKALDAQLARNREENEALIRQADALEAR